MTGEWPGWLAIFGAENDVHQDVGERLRHAINRAFSPVFELSDLDLGRRPRLEMRRAFGLIAARDEQRFMRAHSFQRQFRLRRGYLAGEQLAA
jgi:hypothetical protein